MCVSLCYYRGLAGELVYLRLTSVCVCEINSGQFAGVIRKIKVFHDAIEEPFLSKCFHKETLTSEEPLCYTKGSLW